MTIVNENARRREHVIAGSATLVYDFPILDEVDIKVIQEGVVLTLGTHYSVTGVGADAGGTVVLVTLPANGVKVVLLGKQPIKQVSTYTTEAFPPARIQNDFNKRAIVEQQHDEILLRCLKFAEASLVDSVTVPDPTVVDTFLRVLTVSPPTVGWGTLAALAGAVGIPLALTNGGTGGSFASTQALARGLGLALWGGAVGAVNLTPAGSTVTLPDPLTTNFFTINAANFSTISVGGQLRTGSTIILFYLGAMTLTSGGGMRLIGNVPYTTVTGDMSVFTFNGALWVETNRMPATAEVAKFWRGDGTWQDVTLRETGGPTTLTIAGIAAGQFLQRSGTTVVGAALPFTSEFISSDQTVTLSTKLTVAHGLGAKPKLVQVVLKNVTAELNYSVGDEASIITQTVNVGIRVISDATNVVIIQTANLEIADKNTPFTNSTITPVNWKWVVRAWR